MKTDCKAFLRGIALLASGAMSLWVNAQTPTQKDIHLEAATRNTGGDKFLKDWTRDRYCMYVDNPALLAEIRTQRAPVQPLQIFDDVWYVGFQNVGQFIVKTSEGFSLIDTLNSTADVDAYTVPMLQSLGLSAAAPLRGVFLTHGHGDHDGGALRLRSIYGTQFPTYIGSGDAPGKPYAPTPLDSSNLGYQKIVLGGKPMTILSSPGHTPGTTSAFIPVLDNGKEQLLLIVGGTAIPTTISASRSYLQSVERMYSAAKDLGAVGTLHPHPIIDGGNQHMSEIIARGSRSPNPYILGNDKLLRTVAIMRECGAAQVAQVDSTSKDPVWRVTTIEYIDGGPTPNSLAARVSSGWGPVANQTVTFTVGETGAACVATTDATGTARCNVRMGPLRPFRDLVTASFAGAQSTDFIDLPSTKTATVGAGKAAPH